MTNRQIRDFQHSIYTYYREHARQMPWRDHLNPYYIMVSELMLQQTQVSRVVPKFNSFIAVFPDIKTLAQAPLSQVIEAWHGLGYNRRARYLHQASQLIFHEHNGQVPDSIDDLVRLPGIGINTAGAIIVYAFNKPAVFVETNIRSVYLHHFFVAQTMVSDTEIRLLVDNTLDRDNPREWYWALMDYGTHLKANKLGTITASSSYKKQSTFAGSRRQIRGKVIKMLIDGPTTLERFASENDTNETRITSILKDLEKEGLITSSNGKWRLTGAERTS